MKELFEIYDGSAEAKKAKGKSKNLSGFHPLFTASARRSIALDALKIWLLLGFIVGIVTGVATGAGAVSVLLERERAHVGNVADVDAVNKVVEHIDELRSDGGN